MKESLLEPDVNVPYVIRNLSSRSTSRHNYPSSSIEGLHAGIETETNAEFSKNPQANQVLPIHANLYFLKGSIEEINPHVRGN